jgi:hypothetical protein
MTMPASDRPLRDLLTATAPFGPSPGSAAPTWIACRGAVRSVAEGVVMCPAGLFAPVAHCLSCRHLEVAEDDRNAARSCSTEPAAPGLADPEPPIASWAELVIELL